MTTLFYAIIYALYVAKAVLTVCTSAEAFVITLLAPVNISVPHLVYKVFKFVSALTSVV